MDIVEIILKVLAKLKSIRCKSSNRNHHFNRLKKKNSVNISINAEKTFDKFNIHS